MSAIDDRRCESVQTHHCSDLFYRRAKEIVCHSTEQFFRSYVCEFAAEVERNHKALDDQIRLHVGSLLLNVSFDSRISITRATRSVAVNRRSLVHNTGSGTAVPAAPYVGGGTSEKSGM